MKIYTELKKTIAADAKIVLDLKVKVSKLEDDLSSTKKHLENKEREISQRKLLLCYLDEIYRLARYQFSRLRNRPNAELTEADRIEMDKWVGRIKTVDGIKQLCQALQELDKYSPSEIKSNLYALIQKIIIEGAYGKK